MKTLLILLTFLFLNLALNADPPKSGDSLGTITTTDGKTYADAKLAVIEPDGISILYADGGAKIPFTSLPPAAQKQFGYDLDKSAFYAREQQYLAEIDRLQQENAQLRQRLNLAAATPPASKAAPASGPKPTVAGFHAFFFQLKSQSTLVGGKVEDGFPKYRGGALGGMNPGEAEVFAQKQWSTLPYDQQVGWEQNAQMYGDPIAKQDALDREAASHPTSATMYNSDGTTSQVQYH
jgi:hypothetical protein